MVIARRMLHLVQDGKEDELEIRIFAPEQDGIDWRCAYEIDWPQACWESAAVGIDAVQAILLAMEKIGTDLYTSDEHRAGSLVWHEPGGGYGFPVPKIIRDLLVGSDARYL